MNIISYVILFIIFILKLSISQVFTEIITYPNVSLAHITEQEENILKNDKIYQSYVTHFIEKTRGTFEELYCVDLQKDYMIDGFEIKGMLTMLKPFIDYRCNQTKCSFSEYWNTTNQNDLPASLYFQYIINSLFLYFPFFIFIILLCVLISFINCLYLDFCFCCCCKYETEKYDTQFIRKLFILLIISTALFAIFGLVTIGLLSPISQAIKKTFCELASTSVFMMTSNWNMTSAVAKTVNSNSSYNWNGIFSLENSVNSTLQKLTLKYDYNNSTDHVISLQGNMTDYGDQMNKFLTVNPNENYVDKYLKIDDPVNRSYIYEDAEKVKAELRDFDNNFRAFTQPFHDGLIEGITTLLNVNGQWNLFETSDIQLNIRKDVYKTLKYYNIIETDYNHYRIINSTVTTLDILFVFVNIGLCLLTIYGYFKVRNAVNELNDKREGKDINKRWMMHLAFNTNIFSSFTFGMTGVIFFIIALLLFEGGIVFERDFYDKQLMNNFTFIEHGELIDNCVKYNTIIEYLGVTVLLGDFSKISSFLPKLNLIKGTEQEAKEWNSFNTKFVDIINHKDHITLDKMKQGENSWDCDKIMDSFLIKTEGDDKYPREEFVLTDYCDKTSSGKKYNDSIINDVNSCPSYIFTTKEKVNSQSLSCEKIIFFDGGKMDDVPYCYTMNCKNSPKDFKIDLDKFFIRCINEDIYPSHYDEAIAIFLKAINVNSSESSFNTRKETYIREIANLSTFLNDYQNAIVKAADFIEILWKSNNVFDEYFLPNGTNKFESMFICDFIGNFTRTFEFFENVFGEEFFFLSIIFILTGFSLVFTSCVILLIIMKLRTNDEISKYNARCEIRKKIDENERKYYLDINNYIEEDDIIAMQNNNITTPITPIQPVKYMKTPNQLPQVNPVIIQTNDAEAKIAEFAIEQENIVDCALKKDMSDLTKNN